MAINTTNTDRSKLEYSTVYKDDVSGTVVEVMTQADAKRVTTIGIYVAEGQDDSSTYTTQQKKAVHDAIAAAVLAKIGAGI